MNGRWFRYSFDDQFHDGENGEAFLDHFFSRWFRIVPASFEEQRLGIDRFFYDLKQPRVLAVEYKTDKLAAQSGNAFIETVSVDTVGEAGWAFTSRADLLLYYVPGKNTIYVLKMNMIRARLSSWLRVHKVRQAPNKGYRTHGILVPLQELERCAHRVLVCE